MIFCYAIRGFRSHLGVYAERDRVNSVMEPHYEILEASGQRSQLSIRAERNSVPGLHERYNQPLRASSKGCQVPFTGLPWGSWCSSGAFQRAPGDS